MQLVSKLLPDLQPKTSHHSLWQKWKQIQAALELEEKLVKAGNPGSLPEFGDLSRRTSGYCFGFKRVIRQEAPWVR